MSTALVPVNPQLPAIFRNATPEMMGELTQGITAGFPIISYKGKVWRIRKGGEEQLYLDANGNAMPAIDVVVVQSNPALSKIFYDKAYEEGANEAPRCFSNNGVKPDVSVQAPISALCATCPNNVWGSRMTPAGKKARACQDSRRMAVVFQHDLYELGEEAPKYLLRVPPASLNPLKDYAEKTLAPKGIPFFAVATTISFDPQEAHPQFRFKPMRLLNDEEGEAIFKMRGSPDVQRVLAEQEFAAGAAANGAAAQASADATGAGATPAQPSATTAPAAAKPAAQKMRPATDEEAGDALLNTAPPPRAAQAAPAASKPAPAAQPTPAAAAAPDPLSQPAPAPRRRKAAAAAAPAPTPDLVEEDEQAPAAQPARNAAPAAAAPPADFDGLLDSILNG